MWWMLAAAALAVSGFFARLPYVVPARWFFGRPRSAEALGRACIVLGAPASLAARVTSLVAVGILVVLSAPIIAGAEWWWCATRTWDLFDSSKWPEQKGRTR